MKQLFFKRHKITFKLIYSEEMIASEKIRGLSKGQGNDSLGLVVVHRTH